MSIDKLEGKTIENIRGNEGGRRLKFVTEDGYEFKLYHRQECCENVRLEDVTGDLDDLVGQKIISAMKSTGSADVSYGIGKWTFYHLRTHNADVTLRWLGESNGYYSVEVSLKITNLEED